MGGMNSGRRGGAPTKEATGAIVIDVNWLMRLGAGASAWRVTMNVTLGRNDPQPITILVRVDRTAGTGVLRVAYDLHHITRSTGAAGSNHRPARDPLPFRRPSVVHCLSRAA